CSKRTPGVRLATSAKTEPPRAVLTERGFAPLFFCPASAPLGKRPRTPVAAWGCGGSVARGRRQSGRCDIKYPLSPNGEECGSHEPSGGTAGAIRGNRYR